VTLANGTVKSPLHIVNLRRYHQRQSVPTPTQSQSSPRLPKARASTPVPVQSQHSSPIPVSSNPSSSRFPASANYNSQFVSHDSDLIISSSGINLDPSGNVNLRSSSNSTLSQSGTSNLRPSDSTSLSPSGSAPPEVSDPSVSPVV
jgi:hypothetical protein